MAGIHWTNPYPCDKSTHVMDKNLIPWRHEICPFLGGLVSSKESKLPYKENPSISLSSFPEKSKILFNAFMYHIAVIHRMKIFYLLVLSSSCEILFRNRWPVWQRRQKWRLLIWKVFTVFLQNDINKKAVLRPLLSGSLHKPFISRREIMSLSFSILAMKHFGQMVVVLPGSVIT